MERKTILLVEDNPDDQELTRLAFAKHNLQNDMVIANDGVEFVEAVRQLGLYWLILNVTLPPRANA